MEDRWTATVKRLFEEKRLTSHQCKVYNKDVKDTTGNEKCGCQRLIRHHSFTGATPSQKPKPEEWNVKDYTKDLENIIYCSTPYQKFLRCSCENQNDIAALYELMTEVNGKPKLIISVYGGRKYFTMNENIEKEFMESMAEAATTLDTWIITSGLNNGAAKLIGEGIARLQALKYERQHVTLLGMAWWGNVTEKTRTMVLGLKEEPNQQETIQVDIPFSFNDNDSHALERNHSHFFLLDDGKYYSPVKQQEGSSTTEQTEFAKVTKHPKEMQRSDFVSHACVTDNCFGVTILVEGGINTCLAISNDIQCGRPVVLIQGSGKMADVIASLMELTGKDDCTPARLPEINEIEHNLKRFPMRIRTTEERQKMIAQIREIMQPSRRMYLTVFRIKSELNLKQTIVYAIFKAHYAQVDEHKPGRSTNRLDIDNENSLGIHLLKLAIKWNCFDQAADLLEELQYVNKPELIATLFKDALRDDRPAFVDFFLRINYDPRQTFYLLKQMKKDKEGKSSSSTLKHSPEETENIVLEYQHQCDLNEQGLRFVFQLYQEALSKTQSLVSNYKSATFPPQTKDQLDTLYARWIGNFISPLFRTTLLLERLKSEIFATLRSLKQHLCWFYLPCYTPRDDGSKTKNPTTVRKAVKKHPVFPVDERMTEQINDGRLAEEGKQAMLRDLLYWAVFTDQIDMVRVLILHLRPRICAALTCSAILKQRARKATTTDKRHMYKQQALDLEIYATDCINACYHKSERKACEIMIREIPLFGKITCMQVAISSRCSRFINTDCFNQVLNRIWFNKLAYTDKSFFEGIKVAASLVTFGLFAPWLLSYRLAEDEDLIDLSEKSLSHRPNHSKTNKVCPPLTAIEEIKKSAPPIRIKTVHSTQLSYAGVNYWTRYTKSPNCTWQCYVKKFKHFHQSPMVKMCYHFASYIWFLLVFSYMLLFKIDSQSQTNWTFHWTEIYTIITISIMLVEDARRTIFYYITNMRESKSYSWTSWMLRLGLQASPYSLFYTGIIIWHVRGTDSNYLIIARIILAFDLEFWYLISLKFISTIKILGPKVFMVQNMIRDLCGFLYVVFICISAYGIVSRAMIKHGEIQFTATSIFTNIFYAPYWFLYSDVGDERKQLDDLISNSSSNLSTEAVATHVLLAFHMLFINILLLNLLIAVFTTTINKVENNTKYFWRYQRYTFIQEYFEKPVLPAPPVIFFCYFLAIGRYIYVKVKQRTTRHRGRTSNKATISGIFRMIPVDSMFTERCTAFEHAATYDYARYVVENKKQERSVHVSN